VVVDSVVDGVVVVVVEMVVGALNKIKNEKII
jgi:hypothetical protein